MTERYIQPWMPWMEREDGVDVKALAWTIVEMLDEHLDETYVLCSLPKGHPYDSEEVYLDKNELIPYT